MHNNENINFQQFFSTNLPGGETKELHRKIREGEDLNYYGKGKFT